MLRKKAFALPESSLTSRPRQGVSPAAHKGLVHAAKVMAGTASDAMQDPALFVHAKADLAARTRVTPYVWPLPPDVDPPVRAMSGA